GRPRATKRAVATATSCRTRKSRPDDLRVVTEVDGRRLKVVHPLEGFPPASRVLGLARDDRRIELPVAVVDAMVVSGVADHQLLPVAAVDDDALMAAGVSRRGHHPHARSYLRVTFQQLEAGPRE